PIHPSHATPPPNRHSLSLHDALPIYGRVGGLCVLHDRLLRGRRLVATPPGVRRQQRVITQRGEVAATGERIDLLGRICRSSVAAPILLRCGGGGGAGGLRAGARGGGLGGLIAGELARRSGARFVRVGCGVGHRGIPGPGGDAYSEGQTGSDEAEDALGTRAWLVRVSHGTIL